ncbi:MAG: phosphohydrolase [Sulfobacillus thermotolerans]|uniref:Phosphohydrolase n=1 Tax=Sulfobacillus thermotolerans TaxID=338644 RepID=A0ABM6RU09_9FIRM|nr:hypothetical protein BXT84_13385 [Sulfobacillus thermotolerans]MCY0906812.1 phosphohydrolase [Sulfobacillus thermotolerans]
MRLLPINQLEPGDVIADTLRNADGRVLLRQGVALNADMIKAVEHWGIPALPVEWPGFEEIDTTPIVSSALIDKMAAWAKKPGGLDSARLHEGQALVRTMRDEQLLAHARAFEMLSVYQAGSAYLSFYANLVGLVMRLADQLAPEWSEAYGLAALLYGYHHPGLDNGQVRDLAPAELADLVQTLRQIRVPAPVVTTLLHYQCRYDGSGTPPLKGEEIYRGGALLGLASAFLMLVFQTDGQALPAHEALEWVMGGGGTDFSLEAVRKLGRVVAPYATGQVVSLGREVAVVYHVPADWPNRPLILMLNGDHQGQKIDLRQPDQQTRVISGVYQKRLWS